MEDQEEEDAMLHALFNGALQDFHSDQTTAAPIDQLRISSIATPSAAGEQEIAITGSSSTQVPPPEKSSSPSETSNEIFQRFPHSRATPMGLGGRGFDPLGRGNARPRATKPTPRGQTREDPSQLVADALRDAGMSELAKMGANSLSSTSQPGPPQNSPQMSGSPSSRSGPSPFSFAASISGSTSRQQPPESSTPHPSSATAKPPKSSMQNLMQRTEEALSKQSNYKGAAAAQAAAQAAGARGNASGGGSGGQDGGMQGLMGMLGGLGNFLPGMGSGPPGEGGAGPSDPGEMLLSLILNKDSLHGPMKELEIQYPQWIVDHQHTVSPELLSKYTAQLEAIRKVCRHFEANSKDFKTLIRLMQEMQELGDPPPEIISDMSGGVLNAQAQAHGQGAELSHELQELMNGGMPQDGFEDADDDISDEQARQLQDKCAMQ